MALAVPSLRDQHPAYTLPEWWHLLSLDAPTIAALWASAFAHAVGIHLPALAPLLLAMGTWLVYVADRLLDGLRAQPGLRPRHFFYARHRSAFLVAAIAVSGLLTCLILTRMQAEVRREDSLVFAAAMVYFVMVHLGSRVERWLPKELAVGLLFAAATAVPAWARLPHGREHLVPLVLLFACLCWINCVAIEHWEHSETSRNLVVHASTNWAARHLRLLSTALILAAIATAAGERLAAALGLFCLAVAASALLLLWLDLASTRLGAHRLRIAADAALLTPLPLLLLQLR